MYDNHRIVVVTPAGRKRYLELLIPQVLALRPIVDEYRRWMNTTNEEDIAYMESVAKEHEEFIKLERLGEHYNANFSIYQFFKRCTDPATVYVRFDDDIVWLDDKSRFLDLVKFRIENPRYFLVYANILNNAVLTHLHQKRGNLSKEYGTVEYKCMCDVGWKNAKFAVELHREILSKPSFDVFRFSEPWVLKEYERVSINCISWLGSKFAEFEGNVGRDEEQWLSCDKPKALQQPNVIFGGFVVVHYAFFPQRPLLEGTDILQKYKALRFNKDVPVFI